MQAQELPRCKAATALKKHQNQNKESLLQFKDIIRKENTNKVKTPLINSSEKNKKKNTNYRFEQMSQQYKEKNHSFI
jgi:hypothetical protein